MLINEHAFYIGMNENHWIFLRIPSCSKFSYMIISNIGLNAIKSFEITMEWIPP
jgi:hypothetical protein